MNVRHLTALAIASFATIVTLPAANAQVPYKDPKNIHQRLADQHARIKQGIKHNKLTHKQVARLHAGHAQIVKQVHTDRLHHHGVLTVKEHHKITHELNHRSAKIFKEKHPDHK
jgi:hypothetical protein